MQWERNSKDSWPPTKPCKKSWSENRRIRRFTTGSKDAYEYIISSLRNLTSHAALRPKNADNSAAADL